ncbi:MAG: cbb3-type cytochrome oxidase assembly protein CcoS [Candidatus Melainabacteria bacterium]|nr:cbb3-type cytochrome oxidase assembly protein CcoS [Candidatus Melainabacteria bacterium]
MNVTVQEIIHDLIAQPGLGMFAWFCFITFFIALIFFIWALTSGQLKDLEKSKFDMFNDKETHSNG